MQLYSSEPCGEGPLPEKENSGCYGCAIAFLAVLMSGIICIAVI